MGIDGADTVNLVNFSLRSLQGVVLLSPWVDLTDTSSESWAENQEMTGRTVGSVFLNYNRLNYNIQYIQNYSECSCNSVSLGSA